MIFSDISQNISRALIFIVRVFPENSQAKIIQTQAKLSKFSDVKNFLNLIFSLCGLTFTVQNTILHCILGITLGIETINFSPLLKLLQKSNKK